MTKPGHDVSHIQAIEITLAVPSLDGDPDGLTPTLGLDDLLLQTVNPDSGVEDFADLAVLANEDAAFGIF